jgi:SnoaL-like domain
MNKPRTARGLSPTRGLRYGRTMAPAGEGERVMRALCDAFNRLDPASANPWLDPDVEVHDYPGFPDREWHHGYEGVLGWAAKLQRAGTDLHIEPGDFQQAGDEFFYAWRITGTARRSGVPVDLRGFAVGTLRVGKLTRLELYTTREEALEAMGQTEQKL